jgi:hypothetical protein
MDNKKPGIYETWYGNAAAYRGGKIAKDLDMGERIPVSEVNFQKFIRKLELGD